MDAIEIDTTHGPARAHLGVATGTRGTLALGHGAGGGVAAPDLRIAAAAAAGLGLSVALVEQPYRVAGRRSPPPAARLDAAWTDVLAHLRDAGHVTGPLVTGGRSSGARVACRTAAATQAAAVLCLAFPLRPPARAGRAPGPSRLPELEALAVPVLVVQGERDPFGIPPPGPGRRVVPVAGDHSLRGGRDAIAGVVGDWLAEIVGAAATAA